MSSGAMVEASNNSSNASDCLSESRLSTLTLLLIVGQLGASLLILIVLSFTQKRRRLGHKCLWGFPGLPVPVDFLVTPRYRSIYTVIFGVMATSLLEVFNTTQTPSDLNYYLRTFYKILVQPLILVLILSLTYFPLFACVRAPRPLLGRVLGLIYSVIWFLKFPVQIVIGYIPTICDPETHPLDPVKVVSDTAGAVPVFIGALIVVVWYLHKVVVGVARACQRIGGHMSMEEMTDSAEVIDTGTGQYRRLATQPVSPTVGVKHYHLLHVRTLLKKPPVRGEVSRSQKILRALKDYFFPYSPGFRFPLPFLGAIVAMSMLLYQLTITIVIGGISLTATLPAAFNRDLAPLLGNLSRLSNNSLYISELTDLFRISFIGIPVLVCISPVLSFLLCLFLLVHMVSSVSKELKQLAKEGFKVPLPSPASRVPSSWKYVGYQIGFFGLAYVLYTAMVMLLGVVCSALYMGFKFLPSWTVQILIYIIVPVGWSQLVFFSQSVICRFIFFTDRGGKFIAITNSRLFNWFSFVLFFYNGFAGFINAILRTVLASLFTLLLLFRLDRIVMMRGFERFDFGHKAYLGFMYLDYTYNNAVVHVFVGALRRSLRERLRESARSMLSDEGEEGRAARNYTTNVQARSRWLVAYTLIRNPSLLPLTASNLSRSPGRANLVSIAPTTTELNSDELAMLAGTEYASTNWQS